jgi:hypothetical protein
MDNNFEGFEPKQSGEGKKEEKSKEVKEIKQPKYYDLQESDRSKGDHGHEIKD